MKQIWWKDCLGKRTCDRRIQEDWQIRKRLLIVNDDQDIPMTFKIGIENSNINIDNKIEVNTHNDPRAALLEFEPNLNC